MFARLTRLFMSLGLMLGRGPERTTVEFRVRPPTDTPTDASLHIAGSAPELGLWKPNGLKLTRRADGLWTGTIKVPVGTRIEFKITRGSWETVERTAEDRDVTNRVALVNSATVLELTVARFSSGPAPRRAHTLTGDIRIHADFPSKSLNNRRTIRVWLPPGYAENSERRYPVLYLHDGQNVFDEATAAFGVEWRCDETADRLIRAGRVEPIIMVGIDNTPDRMNEYTPAHDAEYRVGGRGDRYARFVAQELKPFIDRTFRTRPERESTGVCGSSLGGLISLHLAETHPTVFGRCAAVSPTLRWDRDRAIRRVERDGAWLADCRLWLDMGTKEGSTQQTQEGQVERARRLARIIRHRGLPEDRFHYLEVDQATHHESCWADRFDRILLFLYPNPPTPVRPAPSPARAATPAAPPRP